MKLTERNLQKLTPDDRNEVDAFQELLHDMGNGLAGDALWEKYGEDYLGPKPARLASHVPVQGSKAMSAKVLAICPFCGAQPEQEDILIHHVERPSCGLQGPWAHGAETAAAAWNRRAASADKPPIEAIREVVRISDREHPAWAEVKAWLASFSIPSQGT